jgi:N-methylhydantoinase A
VTFPLVDNRLRADDLPRLVAAFHRTHEQIYTIKDENDVVEFTTWKVRAIGDTGGKSRRGEPLPPQVGAVVPKSRRPVFIGSAGGAVEVPAYDGAQLASGATIAGPAIIEEPTTTIVLLAGQDATTDPYGNFLVEVR